MNKFALFSIVAGFIFQFGCASTPQTAVDPCLKRRGAIDVGSGSTKAFAAVVDVCSTPKRIVQKLLDEKVKISFGEAIEQSPEHTIPAEMVTDAAIKIANLAEKMVLQKVESIDAVATAAFRKAENGESAAKEISRKTSEVLKSDAAPRSFRFRIIPQSEEAGIGARSALANLPASNAGTVVVWDIGGGSMQMTALSKDENGNEQLQSFYGERASVTFKNEVIRELEKKDPAVQKSPNPLGRNAKKAAALAKKQAENDLGPFLSLHKSHPRWVGIGGVLAISVQKQIDHEVGAPRLTPGQVNSFTQLALAKTLEKRANRRDEEIESEYRETEITNLALVLGFMQALKADKVETVEASLTQGLLLQ